MSRTLGEAEKNRSGRVNATATATDIMDRVLKERDVDLLAVVIGGVPAFKEEYRESVEYDVNVKAIVAIRPTAQLH